VGFITSFTQMNGDFMVFAALAVARAIILAQTERSCWSAGPDRGRVENDLKRRHSMLRLAGTNFYDFGRWTSPRPNSRDPP
jgi:hypothetical protein